MLKFRTVLLVILITLFSFSLFSATRTSTASGNWNNNATWGGNPFPIAGDDVIIATGHLVTLTADAYCKNLTLQGTTGTRLAINTFMCNVSGTLNGPATSFTNAVITTGVGGKLLFSGASRALFGLNWNASHRNWSVEVALNSGSTGTTSTNVQVGYLTVSSGTFQVGSTTSPRELRIDGTGADNTGTITIGSGATLICTGIVGTRTAVATTYCGNIDVYGNLIVQGTRANGSINVKNGGFLTIKRLSSAAGLVSSGFSAQNFVYDDGSTLQYNLQGSVGRMPTGAEILRVTNATTHNLSNLTINNANGINLLASPTISGILKIIAGNITTGTSQNVIFGANGILHYQGNVLQTSTNMEFPAVNGPKSLFIENSSNVNLHADRTINGTLSMISGNLISSTGKVLSFGSLGYLEYKGDIEQTTNDLEFPAINGPAFLITNNPDGVLLHADRTLSEDVFITGHLHFNAHTLTLTKHHMAITGTDNIYGFSPIWTSTSRLISGIYMSLPDTWTTQGTVNGTVDITLFYNESENADAQLRAWNRSVLSDDPFAWMFKSTYPTNDLGTTRSVIMTGLSVISSDGDNGLDWTLTPEQTTLPVEMTSFTAVLMNDTYVSLTWETQSESNLLGYLVYRSNENYMGSAICISPTMIPATNTAVLQRYTFVDPEIEPTQPTYYYWIQHLEYSGINAMHGPVRLVNNGPDTPPAIIPAITSIKSIYPNPFRMNANINYGLSKSENVNLDIYNAKGQKVTSLVSKYQDANTYTVSWNGLDMNGRTCAAGLYYAKLVTNSQHMVKKFILIK